MENTMLKYATLIDKLSDSQKVRLLTDISCLASKEFKVLGVPQLNIGNFKDFCTDSFPKATLANAWDRELWRLTAEEKLSEMAKEKVNLAVTPGPKVKLSPYRRELSEDPYLTSEIATEYSRATGDAACALSGYYLTHAETQWLDRKPDEGALNSFIIAPYRRVCARASTDAVIADIRPLGKAYADVPMQLLDAIDGFSSRFTVCEKATEENTVEFISRRVICINASANALEGAMVKHKNTMASIERNGLALEASLREDERLFLAISREKVDEAVDNVLDFAFSCSERRPAVKESALDEVAMRAALESSVLLKNCDELLPLSGGQKVAVIGSGGYVNDSGDDTVKMCAAELKNSGISCSLVSDTYNADGWKDNVIAAARDYDVIVIFLGFKSGTESGIAKKESLILPTAQLYFLDKIAATKKKIVAVLSSSHTPDVEFASQVDALLYAPIDTECSARAIAQILCGEYNPSGRLASTLYAGSAVAFDKRLYYSQNGMKVGPFVGYRYYDTAEMNVGYPFGHGLSYTQFRYSSLSVNQNAVSFTVTNVGGSFGEEVAEVYVGKKDSAVIRPGKELCGFARVALSPGESRRVELRIEYPTVHVSGEDVTEGGEYRVYVGASVSDIRLSESVLIQGERIPEDGEKLSDYLQTSSNVLEDNYTLEAKYNTMKKSVKNIIAGIVAIALAVGLAAFNAVSGVSSTFVGIVAGILALCAVYFFVMDNVEKSKEYAAQQKLLDEENEKLFDDAERVDSMAAEKLFGNLFDSDDSGADEDNQEVIDVYDDRHLEFIDTQFTLRGAAEEFDRFASEKGYKLGDDAAAELFASLATSKLLISAGMPSDSFGSLAVLLSEYFGSESYIDTVNAAASGHSEDDSHENTFLMALPFALKNALENPEKIHIVALDGLSADKAAEVIKPFVKYINCAKNYNEITITGAANSTATYTIPANLWILVNLEDGARITELPVSMARQMAYNSVKLAKGPAAESISLVHGLNRYQLEYQLEKESKCDIPEELWKKIDKLEKYVSEHADYRIGNKLWLNFEKNIALLVSCGLDLSAATDSTVAARLLPSMSVSLDGNLGDEDKSIVETLEFIFGDDNTGKCKDFIASEENRGSAPAVKSENAENE